MTRALSEVFYCFKAIRCRERLVWGGGGGGGRDGGGSDGGGGDGGGGGSNGGGGNGGGGGGDGGGGIGGREHGETLNLRHVTSKC